jgi:hypothetical protein
MFTVDDFYSSKRANNRAGVEDLSAFNAAVAEILNGIRSTEYDNPNYASAEDLDAGGFVDPGTAFDVNPTITRYNRSDIAAAAPQIAQLAEQMGVNLFTTDDDKPYFYNTGNDDLNDALYGDAWKGDNSFSNQRGTFESPVESMKWDDYAKNVLPGLALGAIAGPMVGTLLKALPSVGTFFSTSSLLSNGLQAGLTSAVSQGIQNGEIDPRTLLADAVTGGVLPDLVGEIPALGELYQDESFAGAFTRGTVNDAVKQAIRDGQLSLEDAAKQGLIQTGFEVTQDIFGDAIQTHLDGEGSDRLLKETLSGEALADMSPEQRQLALDRVANTTDLYGLLGPNGALAKLGFEVDYLPTGSLGDVLQAIGLGNIRGDFDRAWEERENRIEGGMDVAEANNIYYQEVAQYDQRFFDPLAEKSDGSTLAGIYEKNPIAYTGTILSGVEAGNIAGPNNFDFADSLNFTLTTDDKGNVYTDPFEADEEGSLVLPEAPEEVLTDIDEDTTLGMAPEEDPLGDTTEDMVPGLEEEPAGPINGGTALDQVFDPTWSDPNQAEFYNNRLAAGGYTQEELDFAAQRFDEMQDSPGNWAGGNNDWNRNNWALGGWRNRQELQDEMNLSKDIIDSTPIADELEMPTLDGPVIPSITTPEPPQLGDPTMDIPDLPSAGDSVMETPDVLPEAPVENPGETQPPAAAGGGSAGRPASVPRPGRRPRTQEDDVFKLARVMNVNPSGSLEHTRGMFNDLSGRAPTNAAGDVTAQVDPQTRAYIQQMERLEAERLRQKGLFAAIQDPMTMVQNPISLG